MRRILAAIVLVFLVAPTPARAWSVAGHMVTGAMTYEILKKDDPVSLQRVLVLLKANPLYERLWKNKLADVPAGDRDLYLFMLAARWADDVRDLKDYDQPTWHYIGTGFIPPGEPGTVRLPKVAEPNAVTQINANARLACTAPDLADRAVACAWVFHLVGDIHQPLHACSRVTAKMPTGDRGGNRFYIRATPSNRPINLHRFWDDLIIGSDRFTDVRNRATELRLRPEFAAEKLPELRITDPEAWAKESLDLGIRVAHLNGKLQGASSEFAAPVLPSGYAKDAQAVGERRAVVSAYRLAQLLRTGIGPPKR